MAKIRVTTDAGVLIETFDVADWGIDLPVSTNLGPAEADAWLDIAGAIKLALEAELNA